MPTHPCRPRALGGLLLLTTIACGPPRPDFNLVADASTDEGVDSPGTETGGEPGTETGGAEFIPLPDMPPPSCDSWTHNCPDGEKCVPYPSSGGTWDANKCVAVMGAQAVGEPCVSGGWVEATDDCDETSFCWSVMEIDGELIGYCHAFCSGSPDNPQCPESSYCGVAGGGVLAICIPTCDPLLQDCAAGLACFFDGGSFTCIFTIQNIPAGEPCGFINDCAAGLVCLDAEPFPACEGSACCSPFCDISLGDGQCEAVPGTSCVSFFEEGMAWGYEQVGVCIVL